MSKELKFISQQFACSGILFIFAVRGTVIVLGTLGENVYNLIKKRR
jgi:hypothetical protein